MLRRDQHKPVPGKIEHIPFIGKGSWKDRDAYIIITMLCSYPALIARNIEMLFMQPCTGGLRQLCLTYNNTVIAAILLS